MTDQILENILDAGRDDTDERLVSALTIAGSDSGGGAGLQADLKTFAACGVHGTSVVTTVTAQNTRGVSGIQVLPTDIVRQQYGAVTDDLAPVAAKTGALGNGQMIRAVAECLHDRSIERLVVDPVMVSKSGDPLLPEAAHDPMRERLLPQALLATPNRHEVRALTGESVRGVSTMKEAAKRIHDFGVDNVLIKGSHLDDVVRDILYDGTGFVEYGADKVDTNRLHGSGCVFSSAIVARLACDVDLPEAVGFAREFITEAIETAPRVGGGINPVNPMHTCWGSEDE
ncbi:MAG: bifunctional hydroxymethylpyrimidine kinase/phosphomethylpyrimidine kinase [Bradymonadaceae bacterium]